MVASDDDGHQKFGWESAKRRLEQARRALDEVEHLTPAQASELLQRRAIQLAKVPESTPDTSELLEVVRFQLGPEEYAISTEFVLELTRLNEITVIPQTERHFIGITNLRGEVTAIVDLCSFFGITHDEPESPQVLVLGRKKPEFAITIQSIQHVMMLRRNQLVDPAGMSGSQRELMLGCTEQGLLVLDGDALLDCEELFVDQNE